MSIFYLDSSAWVKYYVKEPGSRWVEQFWNLHPPCACSDLGLVEVLATLARRQKQQPAVSGSYGQVVLDVRQQFDAIKSVPLNVAVLSLACEMAQRRALRGADCIHLASATYVRQIVNQPLTFVSADAELLAAGSAEGFSTLDPSIDPPLPHLA